jgi:type IV pilus assembly protein PilF
MMSRGIVRGLTLVAILLAGACASPADQERTRKSVETQTQLGTTYLQRNQPEIAKQHLERALELDPDDVQANNIMALLQWRLRQYDEAERHFRRAIDGNGSRAAAYHNYGAFLCDRGRVDEALRSLEKAAADPLYKAAAEANLNAGACLMTKPSPVLAEKYLREALRINPKLPGALYHMARITYDSGRTLAARAFIQRYFEASEDAPDALLLAVRIETALKDKNAAASYALRLKSKFPKSEEALLLSSNPASQKYKTR